MENISNKVAYLKGFADAIDLSKSGDEGKILKKLIEVVDDMAEALDDVIDAHDELEDKVDEIDEDLGNVEEDFYGDECDCGCCDDDDCDCCDDGGAVCPKCGAEFELDLDALENGDIITCPECGAELNFEYVDDEDETEE